MGGALMQAMRMRFFRTTPAVLACMGALLAGTAAQASTGVACLLAVRVQEVHAQPFSELVLKTQVQGARDDNTHRNDFECSKQFKSGSALWVSLNARKLDSDNPVRAGNRLWLSFRYGDDRSGAVWRKYEVISQDEYMERKNGIQ